jgi:hypothetical protein
MEFSHDLLFMESQFYHESHENCFTTLYAKCHHDHLSAYTRLDHMWFTSMKGRPKDVLVLWMSVLHLASIKLHMLIPSHAPFLFLIQL